MTGPTVCSRCSLTFALVLVNRTDNSNTKHVEELRTEIEKDCDAGMHKDQYEWPAAQVSKKIESD
jgi:hypothetical protein